MPLIVNLLSVICAWLAGSEVESETETKRMSPRNLATASLGKIVSKRKGSKSNSKQADKITVAAKGVGSASRTNVAEVWLPLQGSSPKARVLVKLQGARRAGCSAAMPTSCAHPADTVIVMWCWPMLSHFPQKRTCKCHCVAMCQWKP